MTQRLIQQHGIDAVQQALDKLQKNPVHIRDAKKLYAEKKLKDGELFLITGGTIQKDGDSKEYEAWAAGTFVCGKMLYVIHSSKDRRLERLKRQGVATLLEIIRTKMVDTRKYPWLPTRFQSLNNPDFLLYGATSLDIDPESKKMKKTKQVFDPEEQGFQHPGLES